MNRRLGSTGKGSFFPNLSAPQYRLRLVARYFAANHPAEVHAFGSNHEPRLSLKLELCGLISAYCHSYMSSMVMRSEKRIGVEEKYYVSRRLLFPRLYLRQTTCHKSLFTTNS